MANDNGGGDSKNTDSSTKGKNQPNPTQGGQNQNQGGGWVDQALGQMSDVSSLSPEDSSFISDLKDRRAKGDKELNPADLSRLKNCQNQINGTVQS